MHVARHGRQTVREFRSEDQSPGIPGGFGRPNSRADNSPEESLRDSSSSGIKRRDYCRVRRITAGTTGKIKPTTARDSSHEQKTRNLSFTGSDAKIKESAEMRFSRGRHPVRRSALRRRPDSVFIISGHVHSSARKKNSCP